MKKIVLLTLIVLMQSCSESSTEVKIANEPNALIPSAVGNYWIYVDSLFLNGNLTVTYDTVRITGVSNENGIVIWEVSGNSLATRLLSPKYHISNDTIFQRQPVYGSSQSISGLVFIPIQNGFFQRILGGDAISFAEAKVGSGVIRTPTGDYANYGEYISNDISLVTKDVIVKGVGVVYSEERDVEGINTNLTILKKTTLIKYNIVR